MWAQLVPPSGGGTSSTSVKTLYYAPFAKNIGGVGAAALQCNSSCGVPTAIATGSTVTASLHVTGSAMTVQDSFVLPTGYANQQITIEVIFRCADNTGGHTGSATFTSAQVGANADITNPTLGNSTAITLTPSSTASGRVVASGTFTPVWTDGNTIYWKAALNQNTLTQDLEPLSVRFYATF